MVPALEKCHAHILASDLEIFIMAKNRAAQSA